MRAVVAALGLAAGLVGSAVAAPLLRFQDILAMPHGQAQRRITYGADPLQFGELWRPSSPGPHPLVIMIHGGCWRADLPGLELQAPLSQALAARGWAVWNLEYRRIGHGGGGYPGTFQDVAAGVDAVRGFAKAENIDLRRVIVMGHSAGGHLAAWAGARGRIPRGGPLWTAQPLPVRGVVTLAGINDLEAFHAHGPDACGGPGVVESLVDQSGRGAPAAYLDTSPARLLPTGVRQVVVSGEMDPIVPPGFGDQYGRAAQAAGDPVEVIVSAGAGHFELIDPQSKAWSSLYPVLDQLKLAAPEPPKP